MANRASSDRLNRSKYMSHITLHVLSRYGTLVAKLSERMS
jgi:hypothetical protein